MITALNKDESEQLGASLTDRLEELLKGKQVSPKIPLLPLQMMFSGCICDVQSQLIGQGKYLRAFSRVKHGQMPLGMPSLSCRDIVSFLVFPRTSKKT